MSYCRTEGKDTIVFVTAEDDAEPSTSTSPAILALREPLEDEPGLITEDGEINWSCPCLGGMAVGPCGPEFREAFSCFHYSQEEAKGSDCYEQFRTMQECMVKYPDLYPSDETNKELTEQESEGLEEEKEEEHRATTENTQDTDHADTSKDDSVS